VKNLVVQGRDPVLKQGTLVYEYEPQSWGLIEAKEKIVPPDGWQHPPLSG
jgi:glucose-6-phosphate 1-dehydrogenase